MLDALTLTLFWLTTASWLAEAQNVLWTLDGAYATYYYDNFASTNGDPCHEGSDGIKSGTTMCQWYMSKEQAPLISSLGTNRFVAVNRNFLAANMWLCGKKVRITQPDGTVYDNSEGDLFVWDGCQAAETKSIVDLSATTFAAISGDSSCSMGTYPPPASAGFTGLKVEILDDYVWKPPCDDSWSTGNAASYSDTECLCHIGTVDPPVASESINPPAIGSCDASGGGGNSSSGASTSLVATSLSTASISTSVYQQPSVTVSVGSTPSQSLPAGAFHEYYNDPNSNTNTTSGGNCTFGAWQCNGNDLQVCGMTTGELAWYTAQSCTASCTITSSGSVICE